MFIKKYFSKKSILKKSTAAIGLALLLIVQTLPVFASEPRDYDSNAIIYGGAYSIGELRDRLQNGSGPNPASGVYGNWQSPNGVRTFYNAVGIKEEQWGVLADGKQHLVNGSVNKKYGQVIVEGREVANGVFSAGRVNMGASTLKYYGSIPIYWREPKYSFASNTLDAFVYLNTDKTFGYAIIKSCGNPVLKSNLFADVKPVQAPQVQKYSVTVKKFNDKDGDKKRDANESFLQGWEFTIKGKGINRPPKTTNKNGELIFGDLPAGTYTITEKMKNGWKSTTGLNKIVTIGPNKTVVFGNKEIPPAPTPTPPAPTPTVAPVVPKTKLSSITVEKFHDRNSDGDRDTGEENLSNWEFTLTGNNLNVKQKTDTTGKILFKDLSDGSYTIKETIISGWRNTTGDNIKVNLSNGDDITLVVGNNESEVLGKVVEKEEEEVLGAATTKGGLPQAGAAEATVAFSLTSLGTSALYWLRSKKAILLALKK